MDRIIDNDMLKSAQSGKSRAGKKDLIKYLQGRKITRNQAIRGKCFDCMGLGEDGTCDTKACPLYPFSPYSKSLRVAVEALTAPKEPILEGC